MVKINERKRFAMRQRQAGLSVLEFVGCVMAVVGGAWLGAIYLGIDPRHVLYVSLAESELLDKVPPQLRPPGPQDERVTREQLVATLREELGGLRTEITALRASGEPSRSANATGHAAATSGGSSSANQITGDKTFAYWTRINEIALGEVALQRDAELAFDDANAAKVFAIKGRISRFAAKAVEAIPHDGVDASVVQFGRQLSHWYNRAGELNEKAVQIWESTASAQGRVKLNEEWNRAELQHRNEARLLSEKAAVVRSAISRRFDREFPEFVQPETAPSSKKNVGKNAG